jgi:hypothetical protein
MALVTVAYQLEVWLRHLYNTPSRRLVAPNIVSKYKAPIISRQPETFFLMDFCRVEARAPAHPMHHCIPWLASS